MFSNRLGSIEESALWQSLSQKRAAGDEILDLTDSNPTRDVEAYPKEAILDALTYQPSPNGHQKARDAVAGYYRERGAVVSPDDVVLTTSTSEGYSFLFKLLCDPGDTVLVPRPSYPLFESLARLDTVDPVPYAIDDGPVEPLPPRCRAILAVHPNNPTGAHIPDDARDHLLELSDTHELAVIVDEVFLDYPIGGPPRQSFAGAERGLVFTLSGLSKLAGLPQMKLAWIVLGGARAHVDGAKRRLEHIADAYLSVDTPVQLAASRLLELAPSIRVRIRERLDENLRSLEKAIQRVPEITFPMPEGGWYGTLRLPAIASADAWALDFLERANVYVHPGSLFGFAAGEYVVVSLLTAPETFARALDRVLGIVADRVDSSGE